MKKKITAIILTIATILLCGGFTIVKANNEIIEISTATVNNIDFSTCVKIDRLDEFVDDNILTYDMSQLKNLIAMKKADQNAAHKLANSARELNWPENSDPIESAKAEWWNSKLAIEVYNERYQELYAQSEEAKWATKKSEYPLATEVWRFMKNLGWNDYVCAGIMGNLMAETGGQTLNLNPNLYYGGYYGMCQWSKSYGKVWGTGLKEQCNFLRDTIKYEIDTFGYAYTKGFNFNSFLNMDNERDAALAFAKTYERCASFTYKVRQDNAEKAYDYFVNN